MKELHLIANAHIDPVWQWNWQEGVGVALSTFAAAADLCEEYPDFVFNHNEALLYQWVEAYDPALFERIRKLVAQGRWHVMGGWFLQPDCNLPCEESLIRQILRGRWYFSEKFGVTPTAAASLDAFGHSRGLVQILQQAGYDSYYFMRGAEDRPEAFVWQGYADSTVTAQRLLTCYNTPMGKSADAIRAYIRQFPDDAVHFRFWGVGNHGGGASRKDLEDLAGLAKEESTALLQSTPEAYINTLDIAALPAVAAEIGPVFTGAYVSMQRIKQQNRRLESALFTAEAMATLANVHHATSYPAEKLDAAEREMLFCQFHDTLAGTCVESAEENALQRQHSGLQATEESCLDSMYALCYDEKPAAPGETPVFVFQPLAEWRSAMLECEFMLPDQNWENEDTDVTVLCNGEAVPSQVLKEESNLNLDWRKRIGILAPLTPMGITRFDIRLHRVKAPLRQVRKPAEETVSVPTDWGEVIVDCRTGCLRSLRRDGRELIGRGFGGLWQYRDSADPWSMNDTVLGDEPQVLSLLTGDELSAFTGRPEVAAVTVTEDGPVMTRIQVLVGYGSARACVQYTVCRHLPTVDVDIRLYHTEPEKLYRLYLPMREACRFRGQDMGGARWLDDGPTEQSVHAWVAAVSGDDWQLGIINDGCGSVSVRDGQLQATLMRSPAYVAHPLLGRPLLREQSFLPHIDQGARRMRFRLLVGPLTEAELDNAAAEFNTPPVAISLFPRGGHTNHPSLTVDGARIIRLCPAHDGRGYILRLIRSDESSGNVTVDWSAAGIHTVLPMAGYQIRTLRIADGQATTVTLSEEPETTVSNI